MERMAKTVAAQLDVGSARLADPAPRVRFQWTAALAAAAPAWLVARAIVLALQGLVISTGQHPVNRMPDLSTFSGPMSELLSWDSAWYLGLAEHGYGAYSSTGERVFPLLPLTTRAVSQLGIPAAASIILICWAAALLFGVLVYRLALELTGDRATATRAVWLSQLAPGAFVLVLGYAEALAGVCAVTFFIAIRRLPDGSRATWLWLAAGFAAGVAAGLDRPVGLILALPGAIELIRVRRASIGQLAARAAVTVSPFVGTGIYLLWTAHVYGQFSMPYKVQTTAGLRGSVVSDPLSSVKQMLNAYTSHSTELLTLILATVTVALVWVCARRLPFSLTAWSAVTVLSALTAPLMSSYARYTAAAVPLLIAAAMITKDKRAWAWTLGASVFAFGYLTYAAFSGTYVP